MFPFSFKILLSSFCSKSLAKSSTDSSILTSFFVWVSGTPKATPRISEYNSSIIFLFFLQFLPVLICASFLDKFEILLFSFFSILLIVVVGTMVGIHSRSLGEVHLNSFLLMVPLIAVAIIDFQVADFFPFIYIIH